MTAKYSSAPTLETERLTLRAFHADDLELLYAMWSDEAVVRYIGGTPLGREDTWRRSLAASGQWPIMGFGYWIAELKTDGCLVGQLGFADFKREMTPSIEGEPELGYVFHPSVHAQGIAFEACDSALHWADDNLPGKSIPAIISLGNDPSMKLAQRLGFIRQPDGLYRGETTTLWRRPAR